MTRIFSFVLSALLPFLFGCSNPQPGPDKTASGAVLGAAWGAGAGAVIGNQIGNVGPGAGVGAGFGAVGGMLAGAGYDLNESELLRQEQELASLKMSNTANRRELGHLQARLDDLVTTDLGGGVYQVFFDADTTSLRAGATANLEAIATSIQRNPSAHRIHVVGHTDDSGSKDHNEKLAQARARTVSAYLSARGISADQIEVNSYGSKRPIASNTTPVGRQLNRRVDIYIAADR